MALTGKADGACNDVTPGNIDPSGTCVDQGVTNCGTDGKCAAAAACELYVAGTVGCTGGATTCSGSTLTTKNACDGNGNCTQGGATSRAPTASTARATTCHTSCSTGTGQCATGLFCDNGTSCKSNNAGASCGSGTDCSSAHCLGAVCCAAACSTSGSCGAVACAAGTGACVWTAALTACGGGPGCSGTMVNGHECDGLGTCQMLNYSCSGSCTGGLASCTGDSDCLYGWCNAGTCTPKAQSGASCAANSTNQCVNGNCSAGGVCP